MIKCSTFAVQFIYKQLHLWVSAISQIAY